MHFYFKIFDVKTKKKCNLWTVVVILSVLGTFPKIFI